MKTNCRGLLFAVILIALFVGSGLLGAFSRHDSSRSPASSGSGTLVLPFDVLTQHNNNARTGTNMSETILTSSNITPSTFGMLFTIPVDGQVYAQPLFIGGVDLGSAGTHNLLVVATMNNVISAYDADNGAQLWADKLGSPVPASDYGQNYQDILGNVGIVSTPVIDPASDTVYSVATTQERDSSSMRNSYHHRLHALDLLTGHEKAGSPIDMITGVPGQGEGSAEGWVYLDNFWQMQRPALLLANNRVFVAFGSYGDFQPYHGWILAYDATTLQQLGVFNTSPNTGGAGIWQSGQGLAADAKGNVFGVTGNGFNSDASQITDRPNSVLRLSLGAHGLSLADYFTPSNWSGLDEQDLDVGVSGPVLIQDANLVVCGSKTGTLYSMLQNKLGKLILADTGVVQEFVAGQGHIHGTPIYWNGSAGPLLYLWSENDYLKAFQLNGQLFNTTPVMKSSFSDVPSSRAGGTLSISSNGSTAGSGVLWANLADAGNVSQAIQPGILRVFDAANLGRELWNSRINPGRDDFGNFAKFVPPTVANGRVYMATLSNQIAVYGLLHYSYPILEPARLREE